jgi:hypothetical protein
MVAVVVVVVMYLANDLWVSIAVQVVVLNLKVFAHLEQNRQRCCERLVVGVPRHGHCQRHRQVERVERRLVLDNLLVELDVEQRNVNLVGRWLRCQVQQLAELGLVRHFVEQLDQFHIVRLGLEVLLEQTEQRGKHNERIVDGNGTNLVVVRCAIDWLHHMQQRRNESDAIARGKCQQQAALEHILEAFDTNMELHGE